MKHKTWFRLVLKAIGIVLIGLSLSQVAPLAIFAITLIAGYFGVFYDPNMFLYNWPYWLGGVLEFSLGLYLLCGGKWLLNRIIPSNRPYCPECGYDLSKNQSANCPECGIALPSAMMPTRGSDS